MHRTRIKICGVCRPQDAALAARAGADAIGIVFHPPSPRCVSVAAAREIMGELPPFVTPVGLFVDAPLDVVLGTASALGLRHVQLHGRETPEQVKALQPLFVVKALLVERERFGQMLGEWSDAVRSLGLSNLAGFVLDTAGTGEPGGTGVANDWATVGTVLGAGRDVGRPAIIAAGGLTPESVAAVVRDVRPYAVDVSSGVEETRGRKSEARVEAFVRAVRDADAAI